MTTFKLDLSQNNPLQLPAALPANSSLMVKNGALIEADQGILSSIQRSLIPGYARSEEEKVTSYFLKFFTQVIKDKREVPAAQLKNIICMAEQHLASRTSFRKSLELSESTKKMSRLEHYLFAARSRLKYFDSDQQKEGYRQKVLSHQNELFNKWDDLGFEAKPDDKEIFYAHPDLVEYVFKNHLHRHIRHHDYQHHITQLPLIKRREGIWVAEQEPFLKMNNQLTPWSKIRGRLKVRDKDMQLSSIEDGGRKQFWSYLNEGFVPHDQNDMEHLRPFKKLQQAPLTSRVELITTHAPANKRTFFDRVLGGARHTAFRIVIGRDFQTAHPELPYKAGEVYSFGWGGRFADISSLQPLRTVAGRMYSPDCYEFFAEDLFLTELDLPVEKVNRLFQVIRNKGSEDGVFLHVNNNCCTHATAILREAEVIDIPVQDHMMKLWYQLLIPQWIRDQIDPAAEIIQKYSPAFVIEMVKNLGLFFYSLIWAPIFLLFGAARTKIQYENESGSLQDLDEVALRVRNRSKALFASLYDLFDPAKMTFDLTHNVWKWQLQYQQAHPDKAFFIKQT